MVSEPSILHRPRHGRSAFMSSLKPLLTLVGMLTLTGGLTPAYADAIPEVQVSAEFPSCEGMPARDAGRLAREAEKHGAHERAAQCFLAAGENFRAHKAMIRATEGTTEAAKRK